MAKYTKSQLLDKIKYHEARIKDLEKSIQVLESHKLPEVRLHNSQNVSRRYLYVILCEEGFYYVGQTSNVSNRFKKHLSGKASWFTRLHAPMRIVEVVDVGIKSLSQCMEDETRLTASYMLKHGTHKVRGGDFMQRDETIWKHKLNYYTPVYSSFDA